MLKSFFYSITDYVLNLNFVISSPPGNRTHFNTDTCSICIGQFRFPLETNCGHIFCGKHTSNWFYWNLSLHLLWIFFYLFRIMCICFDYTSVCLTSCEMPFVSPVCEYWKALLDAAASLFIIIPEIFGIGIYILWVLYWRRIAYWIRGKELYKRNGSVLQSPILRAAFFSKFDFLAIKLLIAMCAILDLHAFQSTFMLREHCYTFFWIQIVIHSC